MALVRTLAAVAVAVGIVLGTFFLLTEYGNWGNDNGAERPEPIAATETDQIQVPPSSLSSDDAKERASAGEAEEEVHAVLEAESVESLRENFYDSNSAAEALSQVDTLYAIGENDLAIHLESMVAAACSPTYRLVTIDGMEWIADHLNRYCGTTSFTSEHQEELVKDFWNTFQTDLASARSTLDGLSDEDRSDAINEMIANANDWQGLEVVKALIAMYPTDARSEDAVYDLGQDPRFFGQLGRDVQLGALTLLQCERYASGCGPGNLHTVEMCLTRGFCETGWSMLDFYTNTLSQLQIEQLQQVLAYLAELQQNDPP